MRRAQRRIFFVALSFTLLLGSVASAAPVSTETPGAFTLTANASCSQIDLSWSGSAGAEQYTVYKDGSAVYTVEAWYAFDQPQYGYYTDQSVGAEQTYRYRVVATNSGPSATWSNEVTITTPACPRPITVTVVPQNAEFELQSGQDLPEATFTATVEGIPEPPEPRDQSIDFDNLTVGTAVSTEYQASHGVTFTPISGDQQEHPVVFGPGLPVGNACPGGQSEANSLPNGLAPHSEHNLNFGGTGFGGFMATFDPPITRPAMTLVSVGSSTVTVTYRRVGGTTSTQTVGPNSGAADGACNKDRLTYAGGDDLIEAMTVQSNAPVNSEDGIAIDDLVFTRSITTPAAPYLFWYLSDPTLGQLLQRPDNQARFVLSEAAAPGFYPNAVNVVMGYNFGFYTDAADLTITQPVEPLEVTISAAPTVVAPGSPITVTWEATSGRSNAEDWIAMYPATDPRTPSDQYNNDRWQWVDNNRAGGLASGTRTFTAPPDPGEYVFRYLLGSPPALTWFDDIAESNRVTVRVETSLVRATIQPTSARVTLREQADGGFAGNPEVLFTGHCLDGSNQEIPDALKQWTATVGEVTQTGLWMAPLGKDATGSVTITCTFDGSSPEAASAPVTVDWIPFVPPPPVPEPAQILGDVYAGGNIGNLKLGTHSVVSAGGTVTVEGTRYQIPGYQRSLAGPIVWSSIQRATDRLLDPLIRERARTLPESSISDTFNLNPTGRSNPEGGVWYAPGDLVIGPTTVSGRGTIIVEGSLTVTGSIQYGDESDESSDLLGVIVRNTDRAPTGLTVTGTEKLQGAYFLERGAVSVGVSSLPDGKQFQLFGLVAGESLVFDGDGFTASYDARLAKTPPLGFAELVLPATSEIVP